MPCELTNKNKTALLRALSETGQKTVADAIDRSISYVSRMQDGEGDIPRFAAMAAAMGLKLVRADEQTYKPEVIRALHTLSALALEVSPDLAALKEKS